MTSGWNGIFLILSWSLSDTADVSEDQIYPAVLYGPHDVPSKQPEFLNEAFHILLMIFLVGQNWNQFFPGWHVFMFINKQKFPTSLW